MMVLAVYWQTRGFAFVNYDDNVFVYSNQHVLRGLTWENVVWSLTAGVGSEATDADYWRPLSLMSHMLDVSLFGLHAGAHHLMSVVLHALATLALFLVMRDMTGTLWRSAFLAAVFAVHPLHVESVAWVAERKDVLSGLFFMLTLGAYTRYVRRPFHTGNYALLLLTAALGMSSKPMLVTLPLVLLLLDYWPLNRIGVVPLKMLLTEKLPLFIMAFGVGMLTLNYPGCANDEAWAAMPWFYRAGNALRSYGVYLVQTVWPADLACFYPHPGRSIAWGQVMSSVLLLAVITVAALRSRKRFWLVGWLWFLGTLLPVIGFTQAGEQAHADRYTYLSMNGIVIMLAWGGVEWAGRQRGRRIALGACAAAFLLFLTAASHRQTAVWSDSVTLWSHAVDCTQNNAVAHGNLGSSHAEVGQTPAALASYRRALAIQADYTAARLNLGSSLLNMGNLEAAEAELRQISADDPSRAQALSSLGLVMARKGQLSQAVAYFQQSLSLRPDATTCVNLGLAAVQAGQWQLAADSYSRAVELQPDHIEALFCLGMLHAGRGNQDEALSWYQKAVATAPEHVPSLNNLAWLLATSPKDSLRDGSRAVELMQRALGLPGVDRAYLNRTLAAAYAETGQYAKAVLTARAAMELARGQNNPALADQIHLEERAYLSRSPWREVAEKAARN